MWQKQHSGLSFMILMLILFNALVSFSQNTNNPDQKNDPKTQMWEKTRLGSGKIDTAASQHEKVADPAKDLKTEMWIKSRSDTVVNNRNSADKNSKETNPETDSKSILWEKNRLNIVDSTKINSDTGKMKQNGK